MASSLKVPGSLLALLFPLCGLLVHSQNLSWREFMRQHHLSANVEFKTYKCAKLMKDKTVPTDKKSHIFIYTLWYRIEQICNRNWRDRYKNVYIWTQYPFKILQCYKDKHTNSYKEKSSYSYIEFHCSKNGYVDSIEDIRLLEDIKKKIYPFA